jgi:hypothetical protein
MLLMFRQDNYQLNLHLDNMKNSIRMRKRYNNLVKKIKNEEEKSTIDQLRTARPKKNSQDVQKLLNKIIDVGKNNSIEIEDKEKEIEKMRKQIDDIKQSNIRDDIDETEQINKTIEEMTKAEPLLNYFLDNTETDEIRSFKKAERDAEDLINTNIENLTRIQQEEINRLRDDLMETRSVTITKGDAKSFKTGIKKYDEILSKISAIKAQDAFSPIKNTMEYLDEEEEDSNPETIDNNVYNFKDEIKDLLKIAQNHKFWNVVR